MRLYYADERISTDRIDFSASPIAYLMTYLGGAVQRVVHRGVRPTNVEVPIRTSLNAVRETTNTQDMTETSRTWQ